MNLPIKTLTLIAFGLSQVSAHAEGSLGKSAVKDFQPNRYLGKWYEIVRMPVSFENGMDFVTAEYSLRPDGKIKVLNSGIKNGRPKRAVGKAKFAGAQDTGHLKVSFFGPFYADYVVVELDPEYRYALVISSSEYAWILSREPTLDPATLAKLVEKMRPFGVDVSQLYFTVQK